MRASMHNGSAPSVTASFAAGARVVDQTPVLRNGELLARSGDFQPSTYFHPLPSTWTSRNALPFGSSTYSVRGDSRPARRGLAIAVAGVNCTVPVSAAI